MLADEQGSTNKKCTFLIQMQHRSYSGGIASAARPIKCLLNRSLTRPQQPRRQLLQIGIFVRRTNDPCHLNPTSLGESRPANIVRKAKEWF